MQCQHLLIDKGKLRPCKKKASMKVQIGGYAEYLCMVHFSRCCSNLQPGYTVEEIPYGEQNEV